MHSANDTFSATGNTVSKDPNSTEMCLLSPHESTRQRKVELWARNVWSFSLNADLHVTFRDPLHTVKLRHGADGFTSPPKEGVLRIFSP